MTDFDSKAGLIHRGLGVVARWSNVLLVIPSDSSHDAAVDEMFERLGPQPSAEQVYTAVTKRLREPQILRSVALLISRPEGVEALLYGAVEVVVDDTAVANGSRGISSSSLPRDVDRITVRTSNLSKAADPVAPFDLRQGIAPGGGLTLVPVSNEGGSAVTQSNGQATMSSVSNNLDTRAVPDPAPLGGPTPGPANEPSPALSGGGGSPAPFGQPDNRTSTAAPFGGAAPASPGPGPSDLSQPGNLGSFGEANSRVNGSAGPVGFLVFDDNTQFTVDRSYVVGRDPSSQPGRNLEPLKIETDAKTLSRNHAEINVVDGAVQIIDLESTNGTFMWDKTFERWNQLAPHQAVTIRPGDSVALGRRTFVFEATSPT